MDLHQIGGECTKDTTGFKYGEYGILEGQGVGYRDAKDKNVKKEPE